MLEFELAGLGSRFCAHLIDALVIGLLIAGLATLGALGHGGLDRLNGSGTNWRRRSRRCGVAAAAP